MHLNQIGDLVFSLPLLKALKDHFPGASLHSVIKPHLGELLQDAPWVDNILPRPESLGAKLGLAARLRRAGYDLLVCLPRSEESIVLVACSRAKIKAGFARFPWDFSLDVKETIEGHHGWHNNARLLKRLGIPFAKNDYVGLLTVKADTEGLTLPERFVVVAPGASRRRTAKAWDPEKFAEVMRALYARHGLTPVLVGGKDDQESNGMIARLAQEKKQGSPLHLLDLTAAISLRTLCAVIRKAGLCVGIDSGITHLASALDVPLVVLFGPTDPFYVGPHSARSLVVREDSLPCVPCLLKRCAHLECMRKLSADKVLAACEQVLAMVHPAP